ncbi:hypothetical protein F5984_17855 [Rudanella paleaurantiibacter]|uniref:Uncharacterized protein n=1 Tax=Rudanella paleaurantiibacter TaxID=2614655 RepID=A0A7J5TW82_9BACT|nr:hypothetical protein [Rudanella paleaurantiibacter]KAB7728697.1 hypothetical protein F5984_17855 [Rudanella paleaurantiibacter]
MNEQADAPQISSIDLDNLGEALGNKGMDGETTQAETIGSINSAGDSANDAEKMTPDEANEQA